MHISYFHELEIVKLIKISEKNCYDFFKLVRTSLTSTIMNKAVKFKNGVLQGPIYTSCFFNITIYIHKYLPIYIVCFKNCKLSLLFSNDINLLSMIEERLRKRDLIQF